MEAIGRSPEGTIVARRPRWDTSVGAILSNRLSGQLIGLVLLAVVWEAIARSGLAYQFPAFSEVMIALGRLVTGGRLWTQILFTSQAFLIGYALCLVVGISAGLALGRFRVLSEVLNPFINALMSAPLITFVPVFVVWFGAQSIVSRIAVVFVFGVLVILVNTTTGVREADPRLVEMARSFGASEREVFRKVVLPAAVPLMMAGVRLGTARAVKGMIMGEMLITIVGLGGLIMEYGSSFRTDLLFAVIIVVLVIALGINEVLQAIERRLLHWRTDAVA